jgi:hypothetical protein
MTLDHFHLRTVGFDKTLEQGQAAFKTELTLERRTGEDEK